MKEMQKLPKLKKATRNLDFGHTNPQIALPYGGRIRIDSSTRKIFATF